MTLSGHPIPSHQLGVDLTDDQFDELWVALDPHDQGEVDIQHFTRLLARDEAETAAAQESHAGGGHAQAAAHTVR